MQYSSEEELGGVLHKHLGYASVAFDKAVKLAEFIAALKADPELHKRMQATVAANPTWFDMGEKKQTWAQAVSLATSSATLPSSNSSSSSKRTDNLYPSPGTSTITSSTPHPSGPASVSASGSGRRRSAIGCNQHSASRTRRNRRAARVHRCKGHVAMRQLPAAPVAVRLQHQRQATAQRNASHLASVAAGVDLLTTPSVAASNCTDRKRFAVRWARQRLV